MYPSFINYVKGFDIFMLQETHVTPDKFENFVKMFGGFELVWVPAKKVSTYGRASGGGLYGIKKEKKTVCNISFKNVNNFENLELRQKSDRINVIPVYINSNNWETEFEKIIKFIAVAITDE